MATDTEGYVPEKTHDGIPRIDPTEIEVGKEAEVLYDGRQSPGRVSRRGEVKKVEEQDDGQLHIKIQDREDRYTHLRQVKNFEKYRVTSESRVRNTEVGSLIAVYQKPTTSVEGD
ncbi:hypothetical protein [Halorussus salinus]|uniref:hypothetical protein n=1 Tax=Halorussus salinus TaxID=1364935 RepID=UPI0010921C6D|nr:hypothetical protein [Halorussus salinus]